MAFSSAAGHGNLPNGNFSPVIFSKALQVIVLHIDYQTSLTKMYLVIYLVLNNLQYMVMLILPTQLLTVVLLYQLQVLTNCLPQ